MTGVRGRWDPIGESFRDSLVEPAVKSLWSLLRSSIDTEVWWLLRDSLGTSFWLSLGEAVDGPTERSLEEAQT